MVNLRKAEKRVRGGGVGMEGEVERELDNQFGEIYREGVSNLDLANKFYTGLPKVHLDYGMNVTLEEVNDAIKETKVGEVWAQMEIVFGFTNPFRLL